MFYKEVLIVSHRYMTYAPEFLAILMGLVFRVPLPRTVQKLNLSHTLGLIFFKSPSLNPTH
jgi:hypothetical protein